MVNCGVYWLKQNSIPRGSTKLCRTLGLVKAVKSRLDWIRLNSVPGCQNSFYITRDKKNIHIVGRGFLLSLRISGRGITEPDASWPLETLTLVPSSSLLYPILHGFLQKFNTYFMHHKNHYTIHLKGIDLLIKSK